MSFSEHGFLSPKINLLRSAIREIPSFKLWFDFAEALSRLGIAELKEHKIWQVDHAKFALSAAFIRTHQSFQAVLILIERGMIGDARAVLRTAVEGAIACSILEIDPNFVDALSAAQRRDQLALIREQLSDPYWQERYSPEFLNEMKAKEVELRAEKAHSINWADEAKRVRKDLYSFYRFLSMDGVHTTVFGLNRHFQFDDENRIQHLRGGPDFRDAVDTLHIACLTFLAAAEPFARIFDRKDVVLQLERLSSQADQLPQEEPKGVGAKLNDLEGFWR